MVKAGHEVCVCGGLLCVCVQTSVEVWSGRPLSRGAA
jgi:hypothetical protein